jgi:hypothetical protein
VKIIENVELRSLEFYLSVKAKLKFSRYRPGQTLGVPGG